MRVGAVIILSKGGGFLENQQLIPFVLSKNMHHLPIFNFRLPNGNKADTTPLLPLAYTCTDLGISATIQTMSQSIDAALYYENIVTPPALDDPLTSPDQSSLHFWGGLFAHAPTYHDYGGKKGSNTPNIMTMTRSVWRYEEQDETKRKRDAFPKLVGVVGFDLLLRSLKDILDAASEDLGRTSFPLLVTPFGDTIYHTLQTRFKKRELFDLNRDVSHYEYFVSSQHHVQINIQINIYTYTYIFCSSSFFLAYLSQQYILHSLVSLFLCVLFRAGQCW